MELELEWMAEERGGIAWGIIPLQDGQWAWGIEGQSLTVAPDRETALTQLRAALIRTMRAALDRQELEGTYVYQCPDCRDGRPLVEVDAEGIGHWQPCPRHPDGDWSAPILEVAEEVGLLRYLDPALR